MDLISRQAAIDTLKGLQTWWADSGGFYGGSQPPMEALLDPEDAISALENLPSAQPEIIRCKDCKHFAGEGMYCSCDIIVQFDHFYCYYAERRQDG